MTRNTTTNIPASVRQKLLNVAQTQGLDFQRVLGEYAAQRTLWRMEKAGLNEELVFKGGRLLNVWLGRFRGTRDMDFSTHRQLDEERLRALFARVSDVAGDDGLVYQKDSIAVERIRTQQELQGLRLTMTCRLGQALIPLQIDVGFSRERSPGEHLEEIPSIIDRPAARVMAYSPQSVIGEKVLAAVKYGEFNSRMKDFYDIALLARRLDFSGVALADGLRAAFQEEQVELPATLKVNVNGGDGKWRAFLRKSAVSEPFPYTLLCKEVERFISPCLASMQRGEERKLRWKAGLGWSTKQPALGMDF